MAPDIAKKDKEDGLKLSRQAQHERRKHAVRLHRQGQSFKQVAVALSMSENTVRSAVKLAQAEGIKALAPGPTGRSPGDKCRLTAQQELHTPSVFVHISLIHAFDMPFIHPAIKGCIMQRT